jgi:uncharacterized protein YjbI with pentapeptide repeats
MLSRLSGVDFGCTVVFRIFDDSNDCANLSGARLIRTDLRGARLDGADLRGAQFNSVKLQGASLNGAQLQGAAIFGSYFNGAQLNEVTFDGATLALVEFYGAVLADSTFVAARMLIGNLSGAVLHRADFSLSELDSVAAWGVSGDEIVVVNAKLNVISKRQYYNRVDDWQGNMEELNLVNLDDDDVRALLQRDTSGIIDEFTASSIKEGLDRLKLRWFHLASERPFSAEPVADDAFAKMLVERLVRLSCQSAAVARGIVGADRFDAAPDELRANLASLTTGDCAPEVVSILRKAAEE